ncbi:MAG: transposase [Meiothermus sp.]
MATVSLTLKLPFLDLNRVKAAELERLETLNTALANRILSMPKAERRKLTTASFKDVELGSAWVNQTLRNVNKAKKVKRFKRLPLETNNQNWTLHKVGETYSIAFGLLRGVKKRVPLAVHQGNHRAVLDALLSPRSGEGILAGTHKQGSIKLVQSKKGIWYACISVSWEVPEPAETTRFIGVDRGQNHLAVAATPEGRALFLSFQRIRQIRRHYAAKRRRLQRAGKLKTVERLEQKEQRTIRHINHIISKKLVAFAQEHGCGIRMENLSGIRNTQQRKKTRGQAELNRDFWPYYDLETKTAYKALRAGVPFEKVPAAYTSRTCCRCGALGQRSRHHFHCPRCGYQGHADHNAARNIANWSGLSCPVVLQVPQGGVHDTPPSWVRRTQPARVGERQEPESHGLPATPWRGVGVSIGALLAAPSSPEDQPEGNLRQP